MRARSFAHTCRALPAARRRIGRDCEHLRPMPSCPCPSCPRRRCPCRRARAVGSKTHVLLTGKNSCSAAASARAHTHTVVSLTVACARGTRGTARGARSQSGLANGHMRRKEAARASRIAPIKFARGSSPRSRPELIFLSVCTAARVLRQMWQGADLRRSSGGLIIRRRAEPC